jgi:hypothetical protein
MNFRTIKARLDRLDRMAEKSLIQRAESERKVREAYASMAESFRREGIGPYGKGTPDETRHQMLEHRANGCSHRKLATLGRLWGPLEAPTSDYRLGPGCPWRPA